MGDNYSILGELDDKDKGTDGELRYKYKGTDGKFRFM